MDTPVIVIKNKFKQIYKRAYKAIYVNGKETERFYDSVLVRTVYECGWIGLKCLPSIISYEEHINNFFIYVCHIEDIPKNSFKIDISKVEKDEGRITFKLTVINEKLNNFIQKTLDDQITSNKSIMDSMINYNLKKYFSENLMSRKEGEKLPNIFIRSQSSGIYKDEYKTIFTIQFECILYYSFLERFIPKNIKSTDEFLSLFMRWLCENKFDINFTDISVDDVFYIYNYKMVSESEMAFTLFINVEYKEVVDFLHDVYNDQYPLFGDYRNIDNNNFCKSLCEFCKSNGINM